MPLLLLLLLGCGQVEAWLEPPAPRLPIPPPTVDGIVFTSAVTRSIAPAPPQRADAAGGPVEGPEEELLDTLRRDGGAVDLEVWGDDAQGRVLRALAAAAGLTDVRIVVQPPLPGSGRCGRRPRRTQLAWMDGTRYRALAHHDVYADAVQEVGFVNALLQVRDAPVRVVTTYGEGHGVQGVVGAPDALQALADEGALQPWVPAPSVPGDTGAGYVEAEVDCEVRERADEADP